VPEEDVLNSGPLFEQLKRLYKRSQEIRGSILDQAIWIERIIEDIIAYEFFPDEGEQDKRMKMISFILNIRDLTFSSKVDALERLLKMRHSNIISNHPALLPTLNKIRKLRNRLAHSALDTSEEFLAKHHEDRIQIFFYEDGREKKQVLTLQEMHERLKECSKVIQELVAVKDEVKIDTK